MTRNTANENDQGASQRDSPSDAASRPTAKGLLVGLDGSAGSRHALHWAVGRTAEFGLIQPLITWQYPWWAYTGPVPLAENEFEQQATREVKAVLEQITRDRYLPPIVCRGRPGQTLVETGADHALTVVGTRGRSGMEDALLGSVSSYVVAHAKAPVAVIPPTAPAEGPQDRLVVGIDGSANSVAALEWALTHASPQATIEAVHSWVYPASAMPDLAVMSYDDYEIAAKRVLDETVAAAVESVKTTSRTQPRAEVVKRLEYGDPRAVLHECESDCDLLILGRRGRGGLAHLLLGSVTTALVHQPATAVVVVPAAG